MFDKLRRASTAPREVMALLRRAEEEARVLGAPACEAEHILLALVDGPGKSAPAVLSSLGLSRERITEGLERELATALAGAHIHLADVPRAPEWGDGSRVRWGASAQRVAERSIGESPDDASLRLLLAIVHAEAGVIPRLLTELGVSAPEVETAVSRVT